MERTKALTTEAVEKQFPYVMDALAYCGQPASLLREVL